MATLFAMEDEIAETFEIRTAAHWKALGHPQRVAILDRLRGHAMTNEELARALQCASGKLYFHTRILLNAGFIRLVRTRQKGPITEKLYRATARKIVANGAVSDIDTPPFHAMMTAAAAEYERAWRGDPGLFQIGLQFSVAMTGSQARDFALKVRTIAEQVVASPSTDGEQMPFAITFLAHSRSAIDEAEEGNPL